MFLSRKYRDRAVGLIAAYSLLIGGVVASAEFERAPVKSAQETASTMSAQMRATEASLDRAKTRKPDDCASALQCRSEIVC